MMTESDVLEVLACLEAAGVGVWLDGGWGIDALVGRVSRPHDDLDVAIASEDVATAQEALGLLGFRHAREALPGLPARLVLRDAEGRQVDIHPLVFDEMGAGHQDLGGGTWGIYPAAGLAGAGAVGGKRVRCLSAELQLEFHVGYEPDDQDRHDVALLVQHFGLALPEPYQSR